MTRNRLLAAGLVTPAILFSLLIGAAARAELLEERLILQHASLLYGPGTTRLDGMGLRFAARDENNEINLLDFGDNPAGLLADRDSWSLDTNFSHQELGERSPDSFGFNFRSNSYSLLGAYRRPGVHAFAGGVDFFESRIFEEGRPLADFSNSQYRLLYNRQFGRYGLGLEFRYRGEREKLLQPGAIYLIPRSTQAATGVVGVSALVTPGITVAGRADLRRATLDGESKTDDHDDTFTWKRPNGSASGQLFVDYPRVKGGVDVGQLNGAGEENLDASWSALFVYNPTAYPVRIEKTTMTEKQEVTHLRTRWQLEVIPEVANVFAAYGERNATITTVVAAGVDNGRISADETLDRSELSFGGSLTLLQERVLVGAEYWSEDVDYEDTHPLTGSTRGLSTSGIRAGAEFLALPNLAVRAGLGRRTDERTASAPERNLAFEPGQIGSFDATTVSLGLGLVPTGGILQLDAAYMVDVQSEADVRQNQFSLSLRALF